MSLEAPTISVIIPAYNAAAYIGETLDSVYAQTFTDYEIIVINDGSPDTQQLEKELNRFSSTLRYLKQQNRGAAAARNTGISAANGEFIAFLDADDTWLPEFLESQLAFIKSSNADLVYCDAILVGDASVSGRTFMQVHPSRGDVTAETLLALRVTILTSAVLARKQPILEVGLFTETLRRGHDFELWLRLAKLGIRFAYQRQILAKHRIVETGLSGNMISQLERTLAVLNAIKSRQELTPNENAALQLNFNRTLAALALENGKQKLLTRDYARALHFFREANRLRRSCKVTIATVGIRIAPAALACIYRWRTHRTRQLDSRVGL
jgi:glycosyltransferase involved in cell wall biosynthesis